MKRDKRNKQKLTYRKHQVTAATTPAARRSSTSSQPKSSPSKKKRPKRGSKANSKKKGKQNKKEESNSQAFPESTQRAANDQETNDQVRLDLFLENGPPNPQNPAPAAANADPSDMEGMITEVPVTNEASRDDDNMEIADDDGGVEEEKTGDASSVSTSTSETESKKAPYCRHEQKRRRGQYLLKRRTQHMYVEDPSLYEHRATGVPVETRRRQDEIDERFEKEAEGFEPDVAPSFADDESKVAFDEKTGEIRAACEVGLGAKRLDVDPLPDHGYTWDEDSKDGTVRYKVHERTREAAYKWNARHGSQLPAVYYREFIQTRVKWGRFFRTRKNYARLFHFFGGCMAPADRPFRGRMEVVKRYLVVNAPRFGSPDQVFKGLLNVDDVSESFPANEKWIVEYIFQEFAKYPPEQKQEWIWIAQDDLWNPPTVLGK